MRAVHGMGVLEGGIAAGLVRHSGRVFPNSISAATRSAGRRAAASRSSPRAPMSPRSRTAIAEATELIAAQDAVPVQGEPAVKLGIDRSVQSRNKIKREAANRPETSKTRLQKTK